MIYDGLCGCSHMPFYHPRNQRKIKEKNKRNQIKDNR